jgi:hypothetical protein
MRAHFRCHDKSNGRAAYGHTTQLGQPVCKGSDRSLYDACSLKGLADL